MTNTVDIDVKAKSKDFAQLMRGALDYLNLRLEEVGQMVGMVQNRIECLARGEELFYRSEIQILSVMLGIGLDRLFPLDIKDSEVHKVYKELSNQGVGLIAPLAPPTEDNKMSQLEFERAVVQLNYCAKCLSKFPRERQK